MAIIAASQVAIIMAASHTLVPAAIEAALRMPVPAVTEVDPAASHTLVPAAIEAALRMLVLADITAVKVILVAGVASPARVAQSVARFFSLL